jgi:phosphatidylethanolamine/phosphatidyl-N-methylethanolamine N-methyltransferase
LLKYQRFAWRLKSVDSETVQKVYNNYAVFYDVLFGIITEPGRASAIRDLHLNPGDNVLEVGVGTGLSFPSFLLTVILLA